MKAPAVKADSNPFLNGHDTDNSSDFSTGAGDNEESIYDLNTSQDYNFSRSSRLRTDSDSNMLFEEEGGAKGEDELLIGDMMEDHFGLPGDLSRLKGVYIVNLMVYPDVKPKAFCHFYWFCLQWSRFVKIQEKLIHYVDKTIYHPAV